MNAARRAVLLVAFVIVVVGPATASAHAHDGSHADPAAHHSLRQPVTDQNFYFVMADRFENGDPANDNGDLPPGTGAGQSGFDPTGKGWYHGGDLKGCGRSSTTSRASGRPPSGSRRASRTRRSSRRTTQPATTATGSPTSRTSTRTSAPTRICARWWTVPMPGG